MNWELIESHIEDGFTIKTYVAPETDDPRGHFCADGDSQMGKITDDLGIIEQINDGTLQWFQVKVTASRHGIELSEEYLGACCYASCLDFIDVDGYWFDMCQEVSSEARRMVEKLEYPEKVA